MGTKLAPQPPGSDAKEALFLLRTGYITPATVSGEEQEYLMFLFILIKGVICHRSTDHSPLTQLSAYDLLINVSVVW